MKTFSCNNYSFFKLIYSIVSLLSICLVCTTVQAIVYGKAVSGMAMHGEPKYGEGFTHFEYANPDAPKGGLITMGATNSFDTLNPYTLKGTAAAGMNLISGLTAVNLTAQSDDEAFSQYGYLAQSILIDENNSWVEFSLRPEAQWDDGKPITAQDVAFSFNTLTTKGSPFFRAYYSEVARVVAIDNKTVRFEFSTTDNSELPLIIGQIPIIPKHWWQGREFSKTLLDIPVSGGPYRIKSFDTGRYIEYERVENWWGENIAVNKGRFNFDTMRFEYYRDQTVALEAFKAGEFDYRREGNSKFWATQYTGKYFDQNNIIKMQQYHELTRGMVGFIYNLRNPLFQDVRIREALGYAFNFEWSNANLFYGQYTRTQSYFANSELASKDLPSKEELEILLPLKDKVPAQLFEQAYKAPVAKNNSQFRQNLRSALILLSQAGWKVVDNKLTQKQTGEQFEFELLLLNPEFERIALPFQKNLKRLGVTMRIRTIDSAQYKQRTNEFDFDMIVNGFGQSLSPGNEQLDFWGSAKADIKGSRNLIGIENPALDELIRQIIAAPNREQLVYRTRALDRVLLWNFYVIPNWHSDYFRIAYWNRFGKPELTPRYGLGLNSWWVDDDKDAEIDDLLN